MTITMRMMKMQGYRGRTQLISHCLGLGHGHGHGHSYGRGCCLEVSGSA